MRVQNIRSNQQTSKNQNFGMKMIKFKDGTIWPEQILNLSQCGKNCQLRVDFKEVPFPGKEPRVKNYVILVGQNVDRIAKIISRATKGTGVVDLSKHELC